MTISHLDIHAVAAMVRKADGLEYLAVAIAGSEAEAVGGILLEAGDGAAIIRSLHASARVEAKGADA